MTSRDPKSGHPLEHHGFIPSSQEDLLRQRVKVEIRKRMRGLRAALPAAARAQRSARVVERLQQCEPVASAKSVALFWPMEERNEVDLRSALPLLLARGIDVALPAIEGDSTCLRLMRDESSLERHELGFLQPASACPLAVVDVIVVPALAVDPRGHRLGYGMGHYDRLLPRLPSGTIAIAVAYDFQLVAEVPDMPWDVPVAWVVTDARTLRCG